MNLFNQNDPDELNNDADSALPESEFTGNSFDNDLPDGLKKDEESEGEQLGFASLVGGKNTPIG
ncbi:hypothetical protein [Mucilaginibacter sp. OK283]|jgi:hypothetical protein|uniref:hypothetical protein n=1 Tax=Mucilaginibacter sp. OK283 TaxID=1881049 RepID=UPI0008C5D0C7|nr:hypothetical protein [Mucilaginibacter sp. OK283]SEO34154.1 hypothetical protein SAMN05428947_10230 [Mucilaginibacter sp. OK283]